MKTSLADYLLSTLALSVLLAASIWPVWFFSTWSSDWFGDYHVLVDLALVLLFYGVLSALAIRVLLRLHPMQPGTYSMDSPTFTWWKLITVLYHFGQSALKPLTPIFLTPLVAMLYGAKVGSGVALGGSDWRWAAMTRPASDREAGTVADRIIHRSMPQDPPAPCA